MDKTLELVIKHMEKNGGYVKFITKEKNALKHSRFDDKEYPCDYEWDAACLYYDGEQWIIQDVRTNQELKLKDYGEKWHLQDDDIDWNETDKLTPEEYELLKEVLL